MTKKVDQILRADIQREHSIFKGEAPRLTLPKINGVYVYPMINEVLMPYMPYNITPSSDIQNDTLELASAFGGAIFFVDEKEYVSRMGNEIVATKFKGCRGILAIVESFIPNSDDDEGPGEAFVHTLMPGVLGNCKWDGLIVSGSVIPETDELIEHDAKEAEITKILEERFDACMHFLVPDSKKQMTERLRRYSLNTQERLSFMIQYSPLENDEMLEILRYRNLSERRMALVTKLSEHIEKLQMREELNRRTMQQMTQAQKTDFLRTQLRTIQQELSMEAEDDEIQQLNLKASQMNWNEDTRNAYNKELRRLMRYAPNSPEYALQYSYLETFLDLPWDKYDESVFELGEVRKVLDNDHYALEKVKDRIVEQMAVLMLRKDMKAPILCLVGPPGVGKTSLGKSVAKALGRKYVRVALGGVHDEAEIRGHRRTYLGSMPGRIISALQKCGTSNPVMVLDEIDKLGADYKGDPSTALLEVLDPEQNNRFHDNYLDHDYDLSKILFIATANSLDTISGPLLDRMEVIEVGGYLEDEKVHIAQDHLIGRNLERHGFEKDEVKFDEKALRTIIEFYTRESGVRQLEKRIAEILRKLACKKASNEKFPNLVTEKIAREMLGKQSNFPDKYENNDTPGVVTGLAWTQSGGDILFIESIVYNSDQPKIEMTGNLGNVMKESATLAMQYLRANASRYGITRNLDKCAVHIHVPEGAIPKDGPSAGITMLTSLASTLTGRKVKSRLAMTGELTLRGRVLPVGGIKEKILAAKQAGIQEVILCNQNQKDIEEIPAEYLHGLQFHYVDTASEVLSLSLPDELA